MDWFWILLSGALMIVLLFGLVMLYVAYEMVMIQERRAGKQ